MDMNEMFSEATETVETTAVEKRTRDPLSKFKELSEDQQVLVNEMVDSIIEQLGGADNIDLSILLGLLDRLNAEKKSAREIAAQKAKKQKELDKAQALENGKIVADKKLVKEGDSVTYYAATAKVTFEASVVKITEKGVRVNIQPDTKAILKDGTITTAGKLSGIVFGMKSVAFGKIATINGATLADCIAA